MAMGLCRMSLVERARHFARIFPPEVCRGPFERWDARVLSLICQRLRVPHLPPFAKERISLSPQYGGAGIASLSQITDEGYFTGGLAAAPDTAGFVKSDDDIPSLNSMRDAHNRLLLQFGPIGSELLSNFNLQWSAYSRDDSKGPAGVQSTLSTRRLQAVFNNLISMADARAADVAALRSASGDGAGRWLTVLRSSESNSFSDEEFAAAFCISFQLAPRMDVDGDTLRCKCGTLLTEKAAGDVLAHVMTCKHLPNLHKIRRHDNINRAVVHHLRRAKLVVSGEVTEKHQRQHGGRDKAKTTPDFTIYTGKIMGDVKVVNPTAESYIRNAKRVALAAAARSEQEKKRHYAPLMAQRPGWRFIPFVLETHGSIGTEAKGFVKEVATRYEIRFGQAAAKRFQLQFSTALSVSLQKDNARVLLQSLSFLCLGDDRGRC
jgi:hypothetical protein